MQNTDVYIHIISMLIILIFSLFYAVYLLISEDTNPIIRLICIIVIIVTIYIGMNRNTYLPFLGYSVMPPSIFSQELVPTGANVRYVLNVPDAENGTLILYWGAESSKHNDIVKSNPIDAYGDYSNTGLIRVKDHKATLHFNCPDKYTVFNSKTLDRHIHYRIIYPHNGMMSQVYTIYVNC